MTRLPPCFITVWSAFHERGLVAGPTMTPLGEQRGDRRDAPNRAVELLRAALEPVSQELRARLGPYRADRVGIFLGSSTGGIDRSERAYLQFLTEGQMSETYSLEMSHSHRSLIEEVRGDFGIEGPAYVVSTACSSSAKAIAAAQRWLALGQIDAALVGGADSKTALTRLGFRSLNLIDPEGCRPFDATRRGLELGEGAAVLLLERRPSDSAPPLFLRAVGESNDAYDLTAPDPEGKGAELAMRRALQIAGIEPDDIDYVNAHGTGTRQNDLSETRAIARVFGQSTPFSSTKNRTGHLLGTAGALEAVLCIQALLDQSAPLNPRPREPDRDLACQPLVDAPPRALARVLSNSFAFGGSNASVLIAREEGSAAIELPHTKIYLMTADHRLAESHPHSGSELLPPRVRSRASPLTRMVADLFTSLTKAGASHDQALILGSAFGEMSTTLTLLAQLAREDQLSPLRFPGSVHNAAVGIITQITHNYGYATALAAGPDTVAATIADTLAYLRCHGGEALALVADENGPSALLGGATFPALGLGFRFIGALEAPGGAWAEVGDLRGARNEVRPIIPSEFHQGLSDLAGPIEHAPAAFGLELAHTVARTKRLERPAWFSVGPTSRLELLPVPG